MQSEFDVFNAAHKRKAYRIKGFYELSPDDIKSRINFFSERVSKKRIENQIHNSNRCERKKFVYNIAKGKNFEELN
jgi:hypothetical protein